MERDFISSRKRRGFLSEKAWLPLTDASKTARRSPTIGRTPAILKQLVKLLYRPWIITILILIFFFGLLENGKTYSMNHTDRCVDRNLPNFQTLPVYSTKPIEVTDQLTLMLNSFHRQDLLQRSLNHYSKCTSVLHQVRVLWCEDEEPPQDQEVYSGGVEVIYDVMNGTSLNNRFTPIEELNTEVVMSIDDDIYIPCSDLHRAFSVWKTNKRALVGFFPRAHKLDENCQFEYFLGTKTFLEGKFSMILTKAALFHRDYLTLFSSHMPQRIRDYVNAKHNCEDIAMQLLIANTTNQPAIFVNSPWITDSGKGPFKVQGISSDRDHQQHRTWCLNELVDMFEGVPLMLQPLNSNGESLIWIRISPLISFFFNLFS